MQRQQPVGIFDSGIGGLSIAHAIRQILPEENFVYFADSGFSPYGTKSEAIIQERSEYIVNFLVKQGCKAIVVACNTATVNSISKLRTKFSVPFIGVEPAIKPAAQKTKTGTIGVLATEQTLRSESFKLLKAKYSKKVRIKTKACTDFISLVENLDHNSERAFKVAQQYIQPLIAQDCDQIILGCTHFSFLHSTIAKVVQDQAHIIDTAAPVAMELNRRLSQLNQQNVNNQTSTAKFWTSGVPSTVIGTMNTLWGQRVSLSKADTFTTL
jgi:glutamate racemase